MRKLKKVSYDEFKAFLDNYKGSITPRHWTGVTAYLDLSSTHPSDNLDDFIIAKEAEPFTNAPTRYYICLK